MCKTRSRFHDKFVCRLFTPRIETSTAIVITVMFVLHLAMGQHVYSTSLLFGSRLFRLDEFLFLGGRLAGQLRGGFVGIVG